MTYVELFGITWIVLAVFWLLCGWLEHRINKLTQRIEKLEDHTDIVFDDDDLKYL